MTNVYLKYGNYSSGTSITWATAKQYTALACYTKYKRSVVNGETLRGKKYQHRKMYRTVYEVTFSANDLYDSTMYNYVIAFFTADKHQISLNGGSTYIDVIFDSEDFDVEFLNNNKYLPEITFEFEVIT